MSTYIINDRAYTLYHSLTEELSFDSEESYIFDLSHLGILDISGNNATDFLQGQLTCDVKAVKETQMRPGGICSLQGRLLALLDVIDWQGLHLVLPQDLVIPSQQSLVKAALFSRVSLKHNSHIVCLGLYMPKAKSLESLPIFLPQGAWHVNQNSDLYCYALSENLFIILMRESAEKDALWNAFPIGQQRGSLAWHYLELQLPRMSIYPNTRGLFLPHRLNLHTTPYLCFSKGCYKGQEIIARTHYRAKLKHSLKVVHLTSAEPIFAGQKCYANLQQSDIGEIIDYCPIDSEHYLAAVSILTEHPDTLYLEKQTQPIKLTDRFALS